jgi:hypothetical protein
MGRQVSYIEGLVNDPDLQREFRNEIESVARLLQPEFSDWCNEGQDMARSVDRNQYPTETLSDVVAMVDLSNDVEYETQYQILARIANGLDMRRYGSSMTIVANSKGGGYNGSAPQQSLTRIAWNSFNRGCPTCRLSWLEQGNLGNVLAGNQLDHLFLAMNGTLRDLDEEKLLESGVPGKPLLFFNYGYAKLTGNNQAKMYSERKDLRRNHRNMRMIMIGAGNTQDMEAVTSGSADDVFGEDSPDTTELSNRLLKVIRETPATFQHTECFTRTSNNDGYTGYVTPGKMQYWAMYPQYFLKSFRMTFEFKAETGKIKVCYRRSPKPEENDNYCREADASDPSKATVSWSARDPCKGKSLDNCDPFYFTVIGLKEPPTANQLCTDERCLNMQQLKWTFTHTGVSCNSAFKLMSPLIVPFTILATLIMVLSRKFE